MPAPIFQQPLVRDLAWAGFSAPLILSPAIRGAGLALSPFWREHLEDLDRDPGPLAAFLDVAPAGRIGIYYERLWHYLLQQDPNTTLLAHNLPVREGERTIGEFDCLYWCERRRAHVHLELAVKFYLGVPGRGCWLGPGGQDRLDAKLEHLLRRQSRLGAHPAARAALAALGIGEYTQVIDIKGYLFTPPGGMPAPAGYNPANPLQQWFTLDEFIALEALPADWIGWQAIPRHRWLSAYRATDATARPWWELEPWLRARLAAGGRPVQLAACDARGAERRRCFVTPAAWPDEATTPQ